MRMYYLALFKLGFRQICNAYEFLKGNAQIEIKKSPFLSPLIPCIEMSIYP
ncbi:hypothetical protein ATHSA_p10006 (plasmid) [Athalassotoga saccharophila]|uniref:Uncharacterized protein n=1 Tax=Athalassotoga saccharophila TaxID=1441386 RepID=A0A6N4TE43_9BACT|nr:hypothetical protein ATHSA_p10006 [Athalassotoga saccharophila]